MIKTPTIMKQNPLIMAEFEKAFSEVDHDVVNILLHSLQNELKLDGDSINLFNYEAIKNREVLIAASTFKTLGKFGVNSNAEIAESLKKISDTSAWVKNFTDSDGNFTKAKNIRIIDNVTWYKEGMLSDGREQSFKVQFNEWFLKISTKDFNIEVGNFTNLQINDIASIKSKHAKKLYEILLAKRYRETTFSIKLQDLQNIFNLQDKPISYFTKIFKQIRPKIVPFIDFKYTVHKEDKIISFEYLK
ncbi:MAG: RepB family plasmid replication initiator protein [Sulfurimonas sp.]